MNEALIRSLASSTTTLTSPICSYLPSTSLYAGLQASLSDYKPLVALTSHYDSLRLHYNAHQSYLQLFTLYKPLRASKLHNQLDMNLLLKPTMPSESLFAYLKGTGEN